MKTTKPVIITALTVLLTLANAGISFAQENAKTGTNESKNAVTLDIMALIKGFVASDSNTDTLFFNISVAYERLLFPGFSIGGEFYLIPGMFYEKDFMFFGIAAAGRYYPFSKYMENFFLGAFLGFNMQFIDWEFKAEQGGFAGMYAGLNAGYKWHFAGMFFVEPSLSYTYSKTDFDFQGKLPNNYGWQAGLRAGVSF